MKNCVPFCEFLIGKNMQVNKILKQNIMENASKEIKNTKNCKLMCKYYEERIKLVKLIF